VRERERERENELCKNTLLLGMKISEIKIHKQNIKNTSLIMNVCYRSTTNVSTRQKQVMQTYIKQNPQYMIGLVKGQNN
jgi:hypothetical protein